MCADYREYAPSERLKAFVECFWSLEPSEPVPAYPVLPDGCVDIVYSPASDSQARVVGAMTHARTFALGRGERQLGVRFRPGMAPCVLRVPGAETTDQSIALSDLWGTKGDQLTEQLAGAASVDECIGLIETHLPDPARPGEIQRLCAAIVQRRGQVRVDDLAFDTGMSARQLRRLFLEQVGLSPKHFCRVIRFRNGAAQLAESNRGDWVQVALDCGYYDQAHFINEFRDLSGFTPGEFTALRR